MFAFMKLHDNDENKNDYNENEDENEKKDYTITTSIDLGLYMDTNKVNIKSVSVWWPKQHLKLNTELKKALLIKKWVTV